jgi:hypothetical protein
MTDTLAPKQIKEEIRKNFIAPVPAPEEEILDWDVTIETPPPRPAGTIRVKLEYAGRSRPIPVSDPHED